MSSAPLLNQGMTSETGPGRKWQPLEVDRTRKTECKDGVASEGMSSCCCTCRRCWLYTLLVYVMIVAVGSIWAWTLPAISIGASDSRLSYIGRWSFVANGAVADWPCVSIRFRVQATAATPIWLSWQGVRMRLNATIRAETSGEIQHTILSGWPVALYGVPLPRIRSKLQLVESGSYIIEVTKLTDAAPYNMGIGTWFAPSKLYFDGLVQPPDSNLTILPARAAAHKMEYVGASDTSGYCVDGSSDDDNWRYAFVGWARQNCYRAAPMILGRMLDADVQVVALPASGVTQNAFASTPWLNGELTMFDYYSKTVLTDGSESLWNFSRFVPHVVLVSLGGNDYNHQNELAPTNAAFDARYKEFLHRVFDAYHVNPQLVVISVCGQGSPVEADIDADNNRCRPCVHVERATRTFALAEPMKRVEYIYVPCDGTVVTGSSDIGCDGHKNFIGQDEVARFLAPKIAALMEWGHVDVLPFP